MKPDHLESFINENRHEFDALEPSGKVWEAISERMGEKPVSRDKLPYWFKIAASLIGLAVLIGGIVYQSNTNKKQQMAEKSVLDPEVKELMEAEAYYAQEVSGKMEEIQKCYQVYPELKVEIEGDLNELETMYLSLKDDLKENISNKEVIEAMIENNRYRMKLVDDVLEQINC
jgi:hypothetical protein